MTDEESQIEGMIEKAGKTAPRIRPQDLDDAIDPNVPVQYHVFPGSNTTVCLITLKNGFTVTGESACVDPANFDEHIGQTVAFKDARSKLWPLLGFALREKLNAEANLMNNPSDPDI
jgi:hypothetical protein